MHRSSPSQCWVWSHLGKVSDQKCETELSELTFFSDRDSFSAPNKFTTLRRKKKTFVLTSYDSSKTKNWVFLQTLDSRIPAWFETLDSGLDVNFPVGHPFKIKQFIYKRHVNIFTF